MYIGVGELEALPSILNQKPRSDHRQPKKQKNASPAPLLTFQPSMDDVFTKACLHAKYRFENFAVSSTNNVAFAAAQAVSKNIGASYNPLFLYGGVGVGKTHLTQSVARIALEKNPNARFTFARETGLRMNSSNLFKTKARCASGKNTGILIS